LEISYETMNKLSSQLDKFRLISHHHIFFRGHSLTTLLYEHQHNGTLQRYLIGYEVANALDKKTFNLYRTLKNGGIVLDRVSEMKIKELISLEVIPKGIYSATLIPFSEGCNYLTNCKIDEVDKAANILIALARG